MNYMDELMQCVDTLVACEETVAKFQASENAHRADHTTKVLRGAVSKINELIKSIDVRKKELSRNLSESVQKELNN